MKHLGLGIGILIVLLLFELWNVCTAGKRGEISITFVSYSKDRNARDFKAAFFLCIIWCVMLLTVLIVYIGKYMKR